MSLPNRLPQQTGAFEWLEQVIPELLSYPLEDFRVHLVEPDNPSTIPSGMVVIVLDRLGRSLKHLVETVNALQQQGIGFKSLQENLDTTSSGGKLIFHIFAALAEFERDIIRERTQAGLSAASARGWQGGRPKGRDATKQAAVMALSQDKSRSVTAICKMLGISRTSYYRYTKHQGQSTQKVE